MQGLAIAIITKLFYNLFKLAKRKARLLEGKEEKTMLFAPKEKGQGLVEYALILVLVAIVVIVILALLGPAIGNVFSTIMNAI
jgi:pilus assembly protein Flp/PilA